MVRIHLRSGKRIISVSVDDEVMDFLDQQPNKSAFICDLIKKAKAEQEQSQPKQEREKPQVEITDKVKELLQVRELIMEKGYLEDAWKKDYFSELEQTWLRDLKAQSIMEEHEGTFGEYIVEAYFKPMFNLRDMEKRAMYYEILKLTCEGDPSEVVYKDVTREKVYAAFQKKEEYSIMQVTSKLGLTYQETYNKVIPWLVRNGFKIE
jgi:hypothetical protein